MKQIQISNASIAYGTRLAVQGLTLDIPERSLVTLLGPSGCGKTTILRTIAGLERLSAGSLKVAGAVVDEPGIRRFLAPERRDIGMVFQSYALWPHLTVSQNIAYPMKISGIPRSERERRTEELLALVGLEGYTAQYPSRLSGGQQQRVAVARALAKQPSVLLFDEPLSNLDARLRRTLRGQLRQLHDRLETTSLFVTHDHEEALAMSDYVAVMLDGRLQQFGTPGEVYDFPATHQIAEFLGFENLFEVEVEDHSAGIVRVRNSDARFLLGEQTSGGFSKATLALRRDQTHLVAPNDPRPSRFEAKVTRTFYVGGRAELTVTYGGVSLETSVDDWTLRRLGMSLPIPGDTISLVLPITGVPLLAANKVSDTGDEYTATDVLRAIQ